MAESTVELSPLRQLFVGGMAGLMADSVAHPFDTIRARIVMQGTLKTYQYSGLFDAIRQISRTEGLRGFYRGFIPVVLGTIPGHALYFFGYETSKRHLTRILKVKPDNFLMTFACGLIADVFGSLAWVPMEVVKQRAMVFPELSQLGICRRILATEGIRGFFQGFMACIYTFAPYVCFNFAFYERFKSMHARYYKREAADLPMSAYLLSAVCSSYLSSLLTTPLCVGRTRIQVTEGKMNTNLFKELLVVLREEGMRSLIEVWKTRALWFAVGTGTTFVAYEFLKNRVAGDKTNTTEKQEENL